MKILDLITVFSIFISLKDLVRTTRVSFSFPSMTLRFPRCFPSRVFSEKPVLVISGLRDLK